MANTPITTAAAPIDTHVELTTSVESTAGLTTSMIGPEPAPAPTTNTPITCNIVAPGSYVTISDTDSVKRASLPAPPAPATHVVGGKTVTAGAPAAEDAPASAPAPTTATAAPPKAAASAPTYTFVNARQARARSRAAAVPRIKQLLAERIGSVIEAGEDLEVIIPNAELPATAFLPVERAARPHTILSKILEEAQYVVSRSDCGTCTLVSWADEDGDDDDFDLVESPMEEVN